MPFIDLPFRLKPVSPYASRLRATLVPQFVRALSNLFFQADVIINL